MANFQDLVYDLTNDKRKLRLVIISAVCLLFGLGMIWFYWGRGTAVLTEADVQNIQALEDAAQQNNATSPPPIQFTEPPIKPPTGRREPM